jgi:putative colanic acid biosynthesis UDP-glucose lipid carrier transferase
MGQNAIRLDKVQAAGSAKGALASDLPALKHERVRLGNLEPAAIVLLNQLDLLVIVGTLFICVLGRGETLSIDYALLGLLAYIVAAQTFGAPDRRNASLSDNADWRFPATCARVLVRWATVVAVLLFIGFVFKVSSRFPRLVVLSWFTLTPFALLGAHALRRKAARWLVESTGSPVRHIIIGANQCGFELARRLPHRDFLGFFDFRNRDRLAQVMDPDQLAGHCKDVAEFVRGHSVAKIYIAIPLSNVPRMDTLMRELRDTTASIYFVPDLFAFDTIQARLVEINGMPALSVCDTPLQGMDAVLKRAVDVVFSALAILAIWPMMLAIAVAIKCSSPGPVLFKQRRYGLNGDEILVYKFRSMTVCEDGAVVRQVTKHDRRVTTVGSFLRRSSLDELPQIFNVLQGRMSLVGPRPHAVAHNEQYRKLISGYMTRHKVRPGITGWAQVSGFRGETETLEKMRERIHCDIEYLRHWSLWLDLKIMMLTAFALLRGRNAY